MRKRSILALVLTVAGVTVMGGGLREARALPTIRHATIALRDWPRGVRPVSIALVSDIHMGNLAMTPRRLAGIVDEVDRAKPDLVLLAGDFIAGHGQRDARRGVAGLSKLAALKAPLGVVAVLGNHDHGTDGAAIWRALTDAGVTVLANRSVVAGPLVMGGLDDQPTGHADADALLRDMRGKPGARVILAHSPDIAAQLPPGPDLVVAGHTHCGQVVIPFWGPVKDVSQYGGRYRCGVVREGARTTIITAGVGTSVLPFRIGAPPDLWLIRVGPAIARPRP